MLLHHRCFLEEPSTAQKAPVLLSLGFRVCFLLLGLPFVDFSLRFLQLADLLLE
jgi:hypothetical protein